MLVFNSCYRKHWSIEDNGEVESVVYDTLTVLNTRKSHGVKGPTKTRIVFHMGVHDVGFEQLS